MKKKIQTEKERKFEKKNEKNFSKKNNSKNFQRPRTILEKHPKFTLANFWLGASPNY